MGLIGSIGLILHPRRNPGPVIESVVQWARKNDAEVLGLPDEVGRIDCSAVAVPDQDLVARADLIVSLGGDGTMLRSMRLLSGSATPVLGVNLGRLGFLAEIDVDELQSALDRIDSGQFTTEARMAVRTRLPDGREVRAFNDIALVRVPGSGMAAIAIRLQDEEFIRYAADAVVVSTSTGSTAYSFAAGGPILSPRVEAILVVPASAHSSFDRALALPADEDVTLELLPRPGDWRSRSTARCSATSTRATGSPCRRAPRRLMSCAWAVRRSTSEHAENSASREVSRRAGEPPGTPPTPRRGAEERAEERVSSGTAADPREAALGRVGRRRKGPWRGACRSCTTSPCRSRV
jgi:Predicted sugar kinase